MKRRCREIAVSLSCCLLCFSGWKGIDDFGIFILFDKQVLQGPYTEKKETLNSSVEIEIFNVLDFET